MLSRLAMVILGAAMLVPAADPNLIKAAKAKVEARDYEAALALLEPALKAHKSDRELRRALSEAYVAFGDSFLYNQQLPVFMRQPNALRYYRLAVACDQTNREARRRIESIRAVGKAVEKEWRRK